MINLVEQRAIALSVSLILLLPAAAIAECDTVVCIGPGCMQFTNCTPSGVQSGQWLDPQWSLRLAGPKEVKLDFDLFDEPTESFSEAQTLFNAAAAVWQTGYRLAGGDCHAKNLHPFDLTLAMPVYGIDWSSVRDDENQFWIVGWFAGEPNPDSEVFEEDDIAATYLYSRGCDPYTYEFGTIRSATMMINFAAYEFPETCWSNGMSYGETEHMLKYIVTHELGHFYGLEHPSEGSGCGNVEESGAWNIMMGPAEADLGCGYACPYSLGPVDEYGIDMLYGRDIGRADMPWSLSLRRAEAGVECYVHAHTPLPTGRLRVARWKGNVGSGSREWIADVPGGGTGWSVLDDVVGQAEAVYSLEGRTDEKWTIYDLITIKNEGVR